MLEVTRRFSAIIALLVGAVSWSAAKPETTPAPSSEHPKSIEERTRGMQRMDGFVPLYWDAATGNLFLEISRFGTEFLYVEGISSGLGSNDIGLDRGTEGPGHVVFFERVGPRILLIEPNLSFRSSSRNTYEQKAVEESFAKSILWGFTVAAESNGHALVDATDFLIRDVTGAGKALRPGKYTLERSRSALNLPRTRAFPKNTEIDVTLTFVKQAGGGRTEASSAPVQGPAPIGQGGGRVEVYRGTGLFSGSVESVTPTAEAVTLREHISLVELPGGGFIPRANDPRAGFFGLSYVDYSAPLGEPMVVRLIRRHRLLRKDPLAAVSEPVRPIQYWVDRGAPEDIQKALLEGARWWNQAFEAAGFQNAFKVDVLPEGVDSMDIRYNVINWVHRSTRGWSTGGTIVDPRTGEIIKAIVTLGSLRDRHDYMIFEGLLSPYLNGLEKPEILYQTALNRVRQLAAHEVGHTLGLAHNYYDSTKGWISVMDYPHPAEKLRDDGTIDLSNAYARRIGEWDKVAINYGYRQFPNGTNESATLNEILEDAWSKDLRFFTNQDTGIHPRVDQWSNGTNQADELNRLMKVRRAALNRLGKETLRRGAPMATLEEPLVPIFMYHRYAVESASSIVAGQNYVYAARGDGRIPTEWENAQNQRKALEALAATLRPSELTVPRRVLELIAPRPPTFGRHRELFPRTSGNVFDPLSPASVASDVTVGFVLQLERCARMVSQHAIDPTLPGLQEVIDRLFKATFDASTQTPYQAEVRRVEERVLVDRLMWIASASPNHQVRAIASHKLKNLTTRLKSKASKGEGDQAHGALLLADIARFLARPAEVEKTIVAPEAPPGPPIGDEGTDWLAPPPGLFRLREAPLELAE